MALPAPVIADIVDYLRDHGWTVTGRWRAADIWSRDEYDVLVPPSDTLADTAIRLRELIRCVADAEGLPERAIWRDITEPDLDIVTYHRADDTDPAVLLSDGARALTALRDLVTHSAYAEVTDSPWRTPDSVPTRVRWLLRETRLTACTGPFGFEVAIPVDHEQSLGRRTAARLLHSATVVETAARSADRFAVAGLPVPDDGGPTTTVDRPPSGQFPGDPVPHDPRAGDPPGDPAPDELTQGDRGPDDVVPTGAADSDESAGSGDRAELPHDETDTLAVLLGRDTVSGKDFRVPLLLLRKHTAVFAGSGSGKTVLLRRLVEEAALHGVSSILIDTNNDLARLGDAWPSPPGTWSAGDRDRAQRYLDDTDVVVWTPRREAGRPLALNPLPDFSVVREDPDEFRTSIDASVAGLVPRAGLTPRKEATGRAVLTEAMTHFARGGGSDLGEFVTLLATLPDGVSTIRNALALAQSMAEELKAAMINDPLFGGAGEHLDPSLLFTPANGKRARVSVISCIGLPTDAQRQTFVNQLQLALFAWIKRNPAGDRPLGGLLVLDEAQTFVPSRGTTASSESTLKLATQARKYGLGMVYATQAPKALHNLVTGNAATQLIGLLNASIQIQAATELARSKGGRVEDISRLPAGRFYAATEGTGFGKIQVPMCLSHHPNSALTEDEVLERARR
ncbi:ATP-binding protein [Nocardia sp. NPDC055053]